MSVVSTSAPRERVPQFEAAGFCGGRSGTRAQALPPRNKAHPTANNASLFPRLSFALKCGKSSLAISPTKKSSFSLRTWNAGVALGWLCAFMLPLAGLYPFGGPRPSAHTSLSSSSIDHNLTSAIILWFLEYPEARCRIATTVLGPSYRGCSARSTALVGKRRGGILVDREWREVRFGDWGGLFQEFFLFVDLFGSILHDIFGSESSPG